MLTNIVAFIKKPYVPWRLANSANKLLCLLKGYRNIVFINTPAGYLKYFNKTYKIKLDQALTPDGLSRKRYSGFKLIFEELLKKKKKGFVIVETGTLRSAGN